MPLYDIIYYMKQVEQFGRQLRYRSLNILISSELKYVFQSLCVNTVDIV